MAAFPHNIQVSVSANPAGDNVTAYNFYVNGVLSVSQASPSATISIPSPGTYIFDVSASNAFGESAKASHTLIAGVPGVPVNLQVVVL
jgi:hypothetical protein